MRSILRFVGKLFCRQVSYAGDDRLAGLERQIDDLRIQLALSRIGCLELAHGQSRLLDLLLDLRREHNDASAGHAALLMILEANDIAPIKICNWLAARIRGRMDQQLAELADETREFNARRPG